MKPPDFGVDDAQDLVGECFGETGKIDQITEGQSNANFSVRLPGERRYFLRVYRDAGAQRLEAAVYERFHGTLEVPRIVRAGDFLSRRYSVQEWMPGVGFAEVLKSGNRDTVLRCGRCIGKFLGKLSRVQFRSWGRFGEQLAVRQIPILSTWIHPLELLLRWRLTRRRLRGRMSDVRRKRVVQCFRAKRRHLTPARAPYCLTHGDFRPENILLLTTGAELQIAAVVDWEYCFSGSSLYDAGKLLRSVEDFEPCFSRELAIGFAETGQTLGEHWLTEARLMDLVNLCGVLALPGQSDEKIHHTLQDLDTCIERLTSS